MNKLYKAVEPYVLDIDLNVLNHLGLNLYSSVPAVLSELVANAWDADATQVDIRITRSKDTGQPVSITVVDNGIGMSDGDLRKKYLTIGYQRRHTQNGDLTPVFRRKVMGRKGIGKLSAFSIARKIDIFTRLENGDPTAIRLDVNKIKQAIKGKRPYNPEPIDETNAICLSNAGTELHLYDLNRRVVSSLDERLAVRLSRRFSIQSEEFKVYFNDEPLDLRYSHIFPKIEYALTYGDVSSLPLKCVEDQLVKRSQVIKVKEHDYEIKGWIGLVSESGDLQDPNDNLNRISVLVRGKMGIENILDVSRDAGLYTKYIIGELEADFLDFSDQDDIATSNRQDFVQSDLRIKALQEFVEKELKYLRTERAKYKEKTGTQSATVIPEVNDWFKSLGKSGKNVAQRLFGKIYQIDVDPVHRKTLLKHSILAFEHLSLQDKLNELASLSMESLESVIQLFSELDSIEATWYHEITRGRLEVIEKLSKHIEDDVVEKIIQKHIYDHLWLLDPSWDRATEMPTLEKTVKAAFERVSKNLTPEEKRARIDIRYKKTSGKHCIIELKRASIEVSDSDLIAQVKKYYRALEKQLQEAEEQGEIEVICIVGKKLNEWDTTEHTKDSIDALKAKNIRVVLYKSLIKDAENAYAAYLEKNKEKNKIQNILKAIDDS
ncbi:MAG: ATP-binding protein [Gammaproteobacteria bacterium]|nr:ATP-binding protein [Gammaproteobacteria bacterium]MDE0252470.1 ATP-binding protein [Gammaproteobacteria bacterium]MDE0402421.1 ATP-binding protein [Gammaproteobacteria bacterium]